MAIKVKKVDSQGGLDRLQIKLTDLFGQDYKKKGDIEGESQIA